MLNDSIIMMDDLIDGSIINDSMTLMNDSMTMMNTSASSFRCGLPPFFPPALNIPQAINYIQATIAITVGLVGCLLNVLLLFTIIKYKSLHQRLMYLALQIVLVDLLYTVTIPPVIFTSGITGEYQFGDFMCNILGFIHDFFAIFRFTMTLMLALDRFISVFCPFFYKRNSFHFICVLLVIVYIVSFVRVILPLSGIMGCFLYVHTQKTCTAFSGCSGGCFILIVCSSLFIISSGMVFPLILYIILFCKTKSLKKKIKLGSVVPSLTTCSTEIACSTNLNFIEDKKSSVFNSMGSDELEIELTSFKKNSKNSVNDDMCLGDTGTGLELQPNDSEHNDKSLHSSEELVKNIRAEPEYQQPTNVVSLSEEKRVKRKKHVSVLSGANTRTNVTMFILLMSVVGCTTPAACLYVIQFLYLEPEPVLFIVNMLVGRTFFNLIPVIDALAIMRHRDVKIVFLKWFKKD